MLSNIGQFEIMLIIDLFRYCANPMFIESYGVKIYLGNTQLYILFALPNHDNGEIKQVPGTPQIRCRMLKKTVGYDLHDTLGGKNY